MKRREKNTNCFNENMTINTDRRNNLANIANIKTQSQRQITSFKRRKMSHAKTPVTPCSGNKRLDTNGVVHSPNAFQYSFTEFLVICYCYVSLLKELHVLLFMHNRAETCVGRVLENNHAKL